MSRRLRHATQALAVSTGKWPREPASLQRTNACARVSNSIDVVRMNPQADLNVACTKPKGRGRSNRAPHASASKQGIEDP
jgi:hypothetical protein